MSLRCIVEFSLHLDSFRNIDLFHQGLYKLRISIQKGQEFSYPYNIVSKYSSQINTDPHLITSSTLEENYLDSKSFLVRYFDELVRIDEFYFFRSEIEIEKNLNESFFSLKIELLFTDLKGKVDPEDTKELAKHPLNFRSLSVSEFLIKFPSSMQSGYFPIVFDDNHCCMITSVLHYLLLDYKFRPYFPSKNHDVSESLALALFKSSHKSGREYIGSSQTDITYNKYMNPLSKTYTKLRDYYLTIIRKCMTEAQRHMLSLYYIPPILSLPGNPVQMLIPSKLCIESISTAALNESDDESISEERPGLSHRFSQRVASHDAKKIATNMMAELSMVSGQIFQLWHKLHEVLPVCSESLINMLKEKYIIRKRQSISNGYIRKVFRSADIGIYSDTKKPETSKAQALSKRKMNSTIAVKNKQFIEKNFVVDCKTQPILIEDFFISDRDLPSGPFELCGTNSNIFSREIRRTETSTHLIVLVHGFQGSSTDMRIIKNLICIHFPSNLYLCSMYNENDTESSIYTLGSRLAKEINDFLIENCVMHLGKITFIGHSLGGLIIRAALP